MQEAEELYDLREAMEAFAVEGVATRLTQAALEQLRRKIDCGGENVHKRPAVGGRLGDHTAEARVVRKNSRSPFDGLRTNG